MDRVAEPSLGTDGVTVVVDLRDLLDIKGRKTNLIEITQLVDDL